MSDGGDNSPGINQRDLERLAEMMGIGLYKLNFKTGAIRLNPVVTRLTGRNLDDLPTTDYTRDTLIVEEDRELSNKAIHSIISGQSDQYHIEYRMVRKDSSIASFEEAAFISDYDKDGQPLCMSAIALDLSRLKWAEEKARDMEMEVKRLTSGRDNNLLAEENRLLRAANATAAMVIGGFHQDYGTVLVQALQMLGESIGANYVGIWRNVERDGSMCCFLKYSWTTRARFVGNAGNIDAGSSDNKILFKYDDLLPGWKEKLGEKKYLICDETGISAEFMDVYDLKGGKSVLLVPFHLHGGFWGMIGFTRKEKIPFTPCEAETLHSGTIILAYSLSRHEILGKVTMDRERALANTLAKGEFLSRMSHEMRTPLNAIIGMTNIALSEKEHHKIMGYLKKVQVASQLMLNIINDILDMAKIEAGKLEILKEPFDFSTMLKNAETIVKVKIDEKKQFFQINPDKSMTNMIVSDEQRLLQVIVNLLNNAMKFTPNEGRISINVIQRKIGENRVRLRVEICDNGIGMTEEQQKRLFHAFEQADGSITRRFGGTGLGLTICKKILNALGGDIWVQSRLHQGACFFFELEVELGEPVNRSNDEAAVPVTEEPQEITRDWGKYHILLADDVDINREIIEITLSETGVHIVSVENGVEAVSQFSAGPDKFDLILMDVQMPVMDGLSATKHIRVMDNPKAKSIPIIAMTANAFREDIDICIDAGMNEHIAKPIDMNTFFAVLEKYLK